jgi:hypothetical protein
MTFMRRHDLFPPIRIVNWRQNKHHSAPTYRLPKKGIYNETERFPFNSEKKGRNFPCAAILSGQNLPE